MAAEELKAELRRLAAEKQADATKRAAVVFAAVAGRIAAEIQALLRVQAERAFRDMRIALNQQPGFQPLPVAIQPQLVNRVVPPPTERSRKAEALIVASLLAFLTAGMAAVAAGGGPEGVDSAVNRLSGRAKLLIRTGGLAVSNRATRLAVETAIPIAKRVLPVALRIPVAIPFAKRLPVVVPAPAPIPAFPVRPPRGPKGPFPGEPAFVILPAPSPAPPFDPTQPIPPHDPNPLPPTPTVTGLLGWQVMSMLLPTTRPKHRHRHKDVFYYHPRPERDEKGMDQCPNPPYESQRDGGTLAYNCVCRIVPFFEGDE